MLKTLGAQVKEFKLPSILTPMFMILEVIMEMVVPLLMASIIDDGVEKGDIRHICLVGLGMVLAALVGLFAGIMGGKYGARASAGFARNLRRAMYENIQTFSFSNIDKYSTAGLITRLTTDVANLQNAYQMILRMFTRAPASLLCAMVMAFVINARLASIYLAAVILLGICLLQCVEALFIQNLNCKFCRFISCSYIEEGDSTAVFQTAGFIQNFPAVRIIKGDVIAFCEGQRLIQLFIGRSQLYGHCHFFLIDFDNVLLSRHGQRLRLCLLLRALCGTNVT